MAVESNRHKHSKIPEHGLDSKRKKTYHFTGIEKVEDRYK